MPCPTGFQFWRTENPARLPGEREPCDPPTARKEQTVVAIFAPDISICTRGVSAGAVASAAYNSRAKMECERDGISYDYTRSHIHERLVCDLGIEAPEHTPERLLDRSTLWNEVEQIEKRADAQLCRKLMVPLPDELTEKQNIELARRMIADRVAEGHIVDAVIHCNRNGTNMHLHMLEPFREVDERGFRPKSENVYLVRDIAYEREAKMNAQELKAAKERGEHWEKVYQYKDGRQLTKEQAEAANLDPIKDRKHKHPEQETRYLNNWNDRDRAEVWREQWATRMNEALESAGRQERVDHRSYERQGVERVPQVHEGYKVRALEMQAERQAQEQGREYEPVTDVRITNREIAQHNIEREIMAMQLRQLEQERKKALEREQQRQQELERDRARERAARNRNSELRERVSELTARVKSSRELLTSRISSLIQSIEAGTERLGRIAEQLQNLSIDKLRERISSYARGTFERAREGTEPLGDREQKARARAEYLGRENREKTSRYREVREEKQAARSRNSELGARKGELEREISANKEIGREVQASIKEIRATTQRLYKVNKMKVNAAGLSFDGTKFQKMDPEKVREAQAKWNAATWGSRYLYDTEPSQAQSMESSPEHISRSNDGPSLSRSR